MSDAVTCTVWHPEAEVDELADEHEDKQHPSASADQQPVTAHHRAMETLTKPRVRNKRSEIISHDAEEDVTKCCSTISEGRKQP